MSMLTLGQYAVFTTVYYIRSEGVTGEMLC
ncbi:hypothetical protein tinsulaeT_03420 [Thalassotalea insulae]|uniref:Uncharacterized protein n=1 Tax=Thalassotalea insulae TaxID=2056778 RepID=A0ABQ6GNS0_9GAMM|nr:hypothetical protein tinsulaeT_03420 [Thalassotalea insulae]